MPGTSVVRGGRVLLGPGPELTWADILIEDGRIAAVAPVVAAPEGARPKTSSSGAATRTNAESTIATIRSPNSRWPAGSPGRPRSSGAPTNASSRGTSQAMRPNP